MHVSARQEEISNILSFQSPIRAKGPIEMCVKKPGSECQEFYFGLDKSFRYASDLQYGMEKLESTDSLQH